MHLKFTQNRQIKLEIPNKTCLYTVAISKDLREDCNLKMIREVIFIKEVEHRLKIK